MGGERHAWSAGTGVSLSAMKTHPAFCSRHGARCCWTADVGVTGKQEGRQRESAETSDTELHGKVDRQLHHAEPEQAGR